MDKIKYIPGCLIGFFLLVISLDPGNTAVSVRKAMEFHNCHDTGSDVELPYQHLIVSIDDDQDWMDSVTFYTFCSCHTLLIYPFLQDMGPEDYTDLLWQPPKYS